MFIYEKVLELVGPVPAGGELLTYVISSIILVYLVSSAFSIIGSIVNHIGGR